MGNRWEVPREMAEVWLEGWLHLDSTQVSLGWIWKGWAGQGPRTIELQVWAPEWVSGCQPGE